MDKSAYYRQNSIVESYESLRYSSAGGAYVNERELSTALSLLPEGGMVLDLPCGLGRFSEAAKVQASEIISADFSLEMLAAAVNLKRVTNIVRADAFQMPFPADTFDAVVSLRFTFHYSSIESLFDEVGRILKPGGVFIFDTYTWSPFMLPGTPMVVGGRSYIHSYRTIHRLAPRHGFKVKATKGCFLFSPLVYRFLPRGAISKFEKIESRVPQRMRNVLFWSLEKSTA